MTAPNFKPEAFLLDLDGVLVDSNPIHIAAYKEAFREFGLVLPETALNLVRLGASRTQVLEAAAVPSSLTASVREAKQVAVLRSISQGALAPTNDVVAFLEHLARAETDVALVSNSSAAGPWVEANELEWAFGVVLDGTEIAVPKPAPDGYIKAAASLGWRPTRCVAVEDSLMGARAARAAGAFVVTIGNLVPPSHTDLTVQALGEIPIDAWMDLPRLDDG